MQPIVGITSDYHKKGDIFKGPAYFIGENYVSAVIDSGGVPIILPYSCDKRMHEELLKRIDGLLITGGNFDVNPMFYGEKPIQNIGKFIDERTVFEMEIARMALRRDMPVLGICGGEQLLNVAGGGSLYQDIPTQVQEAFDHQQKSSKDEPYHSVEIEPGTQLHSIFGCEKINVNSTHHQSVKRTGEGFIINAKAIDGIIEGIESVQHRFVIGVQWHPEFLYKKEKVFEKLFKVFVQSCIDTR